MVTLVNFAKDSLLKEVHKRRTRLQEIRDLIDWDSLAKQLPDRTPEHAGRRPIAHKVMLKVLVLQAWHTISDEETEYQCYNRLDFQDFIQSTNYPDARTIWSYKEWLIENNLEIVFWDALKQELQKHAIEVSEGKIQDATFVHASPGKTQSGLENRGHVAKTSRSKDGTWTKKNSKSVFGFKAHVKVDIKSKIIEELAVTTASTHDNRVDLANEEDVNYRDRGYSGSKTKARGDATMKKGKLSIQQKMRNKRISKIRSRGEHPFGVVHSLFKGGTTKVTTNARVFIQQIFVFTSYNLHRVAVLTRAT